MYFYPPPLPLPRPILYAQCCNGSLTRPAAGGVRVCPSRCDLRCPVTCNALWCGSVSATCTLHAFARYTRRRPRCLMRRVQKDEIYLNLILEYIPETVYRVVRHYNKLKQTIPYIYIKVTTFYFTTFCSLLLYCTIYYKIYSLSTIRPRLGL